MHSCEEIFFIFSTGSYYPDSINSQESLCRGYSQKLIVDGPKTWKPVDFQLFLANEENKRQLCQLLLRVWGSEVAARRLGKATRSVVVVEGKAYVLESTDGEVRIVHAFLRTHVAIIN